METGPAVLARDMRAVSVTGVILPCAGSIILLLLYRTMSKRAQCFSSCCQERCRRRGGKGRGFLVRAMTSDSSPACNNDLDFRSPQEAIGT